MYHSTDPRAALAATPVGAKPAATHFAGAEYAKFYETPPAENQNGARTWYARGQNFIIAYSDADKGAVLSRTEPARRICRAASRSRGGRRDRVGQRAQGRHRSFHQLRAGGRELRHAARRRQGGAHGDDAIGRSRKAVLQRMRPTRRRIPICRRSSRGRRRAAVRRSAPTVSTSRRRPAGSGGSSAARPSW